MTAAPDHIKDLLADPQNRRKHNARNIGLITDALHQVGAARSIVIDEDNEVLAGNGLLEAAASAGITKLQVVDADGDTIIAVRRTGLSDAQKRYLAIADNRTAELATWDAEQLGADMRNGLDLDVFFFPEELQAIIAGDADAAGGGGGEATTPEVARATLAARFGVPPFSVLDARQGYWQDRKRAWLALGIESELGRGEGIVPNGGAARPPEQDGAWRRTGRAPNAVIGGSPLPSDRAGYTPGKSKSKKNPAPGGSPRPAMKTKNGKTLRGDGRGRPLAKPGA